MPTRLLAALALLLCVVSCKKDDPDPIPSDESYTLYFDNEYNELQARFGVFLSDSEGRMRAFRWLPGRDTASLKIAHTQSGDRFDCTVVKITDIDASGSGVVDTSIVLTTYTSLASGETVHLRSLEFRQTLDLIIQFTDITSLDSIIVPDGLTFVRPQASNNFTGQYRILHTGKVWLRLLINGESFWRYMFFDNVAGPDQAATINATILPKLMNSPTKSIGLPYNGPWQYKLEGVVDTANLKYMPLGDLLRAPGGLVPVFDHLAVFEPETKPYSGYRLQLSAPLGPDGTGHASDGYYATLPDAVQEAGFDVQSATPPNARYAAARCLGDFDLLAFTRSYAGLPNVKWEVLLQPVSGQIVTYRLPDLPEQLSDLSFGLKTYSFGSSVLVRAEGYDNLGSFESVIRQRLDSRDPYWQAKGKYLARERIF